MKLTTLILTLLFSVSVFAGTGKQEMQDLLKIQKTTSVTTAAKAQGYDIKRTVKPILKGKFPHFRKFLGEKEGKEQDSFESVVDDGEFDHYYNGDHKKIKANARDILDVKYLYQIGAVYVVTKNGKFVGYIYEISRHGYANVIQDGAWDEVYTDTDMNVIYVDEQSA